MVYLQNSKKKYTIFLITRYFKSWVIIYYALYARTRIDLEWTGKERAGK